MAKLKSKSAKPIPLVKSSQAGPVLFPGSFDPLTLGHVDIVARSLRIFDKVVVAVLNNPLKSTLFTLEERLTLVRNEFRSYGNRVEVQSFSGLLVEFADKVGANVIVRGLRAISDYDYETQMALMNKNLSRDVETLFLVTQESYSFISSTLVKQVAELGGDVSSLVPPGTLKALKRKIR